MDFVAAAPGALARPQLTTVKGDALAHADKRRAGPVGEGDGRPFVGDRDLQDGRLVVLVVAIGNRRDVYRP